jgi:hypothetical protein
MPFRALIRLFKSLIRPFKGLINLFKASNGLMRPYKASFLCFVLSLSRLRDKESLMDWQGA